MRSLNEFLLCGFVANVFSIVFGNVLCCLAMML
jgi:hypothetical protein